MIVLITCVVFLFLVTAFVAYGDHLMKKFPPPEGQSYYFRITPTSYSAGAEDREALKRMSRW